MTSLVNPQAANIERAGFAALGVVITALDDAGAAFGANGLTVNVEALSLLPTSRASPRWSKARCPLRRSRFMRPDQSDVLGQLSTSDS